MSIENYRWLAALVAAHPDGKVVGRTRLQKEVKLLQRLEFPTDYSYTIHFYGPYSESLQGDIGLLEAFDLVDETCVESRDGNPYYILQAKQGADLPDLGKFKDEIAVLSDAPIVVLELAATYDAFREGGANHGEAINRLRRKKGSKCDSGNQEKALALLASIGLESQ
ncbi:MAG: hypothetical protein K8T25_00355 [Planctomycetia bacterium]|nr:hypothetical protein [Planctomycetia bacterium]